MGAADTSTRADACACTSKPQPAAGQRHRTAFKKEAFKKNLNHFNDLLRDLQHWNIDNDEVHQAHLFIVTLTQGEISLHLERALATPILSSSTAMTSQMTDEHKGTRAVTFATSPVNNVTCASDKTAGLHGP